MKGGLRQSRFASQQRFGDPGSDTHSPFVVSIIPISKRDEEPVSAMPFTNGKTLAFGEILGATHGTGQTHEGLSTVTGSRFL